MKGDFSRFTFRRTNHYRNVRLQQGRVLLDADWNEQIDIQSHHSRIVARDVIGLSGAPLHDAGFEPSVEGDNLRIGQGRYYVDGILCENERDVSFAAEPALSDVPPQPDLPSAALPTDSGFYVAYIDVWERHITALEDPAIREVALGGPDTTTRTKTVWQVRLDGPEASRSEFDIDWTPDNAESTGQLRAQPVQGATSEDSRTVSAGSGYRRLENQLYRVEIHDGGEPYGAPRSQTETAVTGVNPPDEVQVADDGRTWQVGQMVELFGGDSEVPGTLARITAVDAARTLTLDKDISGVAPTHLRRVATFKFSRDNGTVLARLISIEDDHITVSEPGKDPALGFAGGQWAELTDEERTLRGEPGSLVKIAPGQGTDLAVSEWPGGTPLTMGNFGTRPTVRRWDSDGAIPVSVGAWLDLEDGVQIEFEAGTYRTEDHWLIPARSLTGSVEWSLDGIEPRFEPRHGTKHQYAPIALLHLQDDGFWTLVSDLRKLFPPIADEAGVQVIRVVLQKTEQTLRDNDDVPVDQLEEGIRVECATKIDPDVVSQRHRCSVTLNIPYLPDSAVPGFLPLILESETSTTGKNIVWKPSPDAQVWLEDPLWGSLPEQGRRVSAHLTLQNSAFEMNVSMVPSQKVQIDVGFIPNVQGELFLEEGVERREGMNEVFERAIDRESLKEALPLGYEVGVNQFAPDMARAGVEFLMRTRKLPEPREREFSSLVVDEQFAEVGAFVRNMLAKIPEVPIRFDKQIDVAAGDLVERVRRLVGEDKGTPEVVICDKKLEESLTQDDVLNRHFKEGTFTVF